MSLILQHPRSPVQFDPRDPPVLADDASVIRAQAATITELQQAIRQMTRTPPSDEFQALETQEALERIAARIGWPRLATIFRFVAARNGEDVDRPLGNCLADGMLLPPSRVCNYCGRDNS